MKPQITALRLGIFVFATLLVLAAGVFLIGDRKFLFQRTYPLKVEFETVAGLIEGAPVRVLGIPKGTVKQILLPRQPDGKVTLILDLARETQGILKRDSVATIQSEGLLGDKYVELSAGSENGEQLKDGDTIGSQPPVDIANLIQKTNEILDSAKEALQNTADATGDLKSITAKINRGQGTVGALINDATVFNQAAAGATAFRENMDALKQNFLLRGFFKKRGYEDTTELSRNAISRLPSGPPMKTFSFDGKKIFDKDDNAKLKNEKSLNDAGKFLQQTKFGLAIVTAVAGTKGDSDKLRELTAARAVVVREYLVNNFQLEDQRIKTLGLGKGKEPDDGGTVEIVVYPPSVGAPHAKPAKGGTSGR